MISEKLELSRVEGRSYEDIQKDVIRMVYKFVGLWYKDFPVLKAHGYDDERIITDVYHGIYLKTRDDGLSNLERHFIKASDEGLSMKYIMNVIKLSVRNMLMCRARDEAKKPLVDSLDREIFTSDGNSTELYELVSDQREAFEKQFELKEFVNSIPNTLYKDYTYNIDGIESTLSTRGIVNFIIEGHNISSMRQIVKNKSGVNITHKTMSELYHKSLELAKEYLIVYLKEDK